MEGFKLVLKEGTFRGGVLLLLLFTSTPNLKILKDDEGNLKFFFSFLNSSAIFNSTKISFNTQNMNLLFFLFNLPYLRRNSSNAFYPLSSYQALSLFIHCALLGCIRIFDAMNL